MKTKPRKQLIGWSLGVAAGLVAATTWAQRARAQRASRLRRTGGERVALVTGASSGIGAAYARALAGEGYALILVARREARLQALATELMRQYHVPVEVLGADLADPAGVADVEARIVETAALAFLVNNAGLGAAGPFVEHDVARQEALIRVHVNAVVRLTRAALPGMLARNSGAIVNVASLMAFYPLPGSATYAATKAYLKAFTEALHQELLETGVRVQALCPGFTHTEFHAANHITERGVPDFVWMSAETVVAQSLRDLDNGRVISVPGWGYHLLARLSGLIPRGLLYYFGYRTRRYRPASSPLSGNTFDSILYRVSGKRWGQ